MTAKFRPAKKLWLENGDGSRRCRACSKVADYIVNDKRTGTLRRTPVCRRDLRGALRDRDDLLAPAEEARA